MTERSHRVRLNILTEPSGNPKTNKNTAYGYLSCGLHLAPANESGLTNLCPAHTTGCAAACIYHAGRAAFSPVVKAARIERTRMLVEEEKLFWAMLRTGRSACTSRSSVARSSSSNAAMTPRSTNWRRGRA